MDAVALAAAQLAHLFLLIGSLEIEAADIVARVDGSCAELDFLKPVADFVVHTTVIVEIVAMLIDIGKLDGVADFDRSGIGLLLPGDHPEQGRFAGAVGADYANDRA